jgi:hypothetical protein
MSAPTTTAEKSQSGGSPLEEQIRRRAYQRYLERAGQDGSELQDWLRAEEEMRKAQEEGLDWNTPWGKRNTESILPQRH